MSPSLCCHIYHPNTQLIDKILDKYLIGQLAGVSSKEGGGVTSYAAADPFYDKVKQRVRKYFRDTGKNMRTSYLLWFQAVVILASIAVLYHLAFYYIKSFPLALLAAMALGFMQTEVGVSIQHDANHGAFSPWPLLNRFAGATLDIMGASSYMSGRSSTL